MAKSKEHSFDISAKIDIQHLKNALNESKKEVINRYDFKGVKADIDYQQKDNTVILIASSDKKLQALEDIVITKLVKHKLNLKIFKEIKRETKINNNKKVIFKIVDYIEAKEARKIVAEIKNLKLKINTQIEGECIRVKGKQLDDLQKVITYISKMDWEAPLIFENKK